MENPNHGRPFVLFSHRSVQESLTRIETWLALGLLPKPLPWRLLSPLFIWIPLEANIGLGSLLSSLPRPVDRVFKPTQGNPMPLSLLKNKI